MTERAEEVTTPIGWALDAVAAVELEADLRINEDLFGDMQPTTSGEVPEKEVKTPPKRSSRRKKKPPGLPKRPLNAYNVFFQQERLKLQQDENLQIGFEEFGKIIGARWKELSDKEREKYDERAREDSVRYRKEMDAYKANNGKRKYEETESAPVTSTTTRQPQWLAPQAFNETGFVTHNGPPPPIHPPSTPSMVPVDARMPPMMGSPWDHFPVPPGMEVTLADNNGRDRKYTVNYSVYSMPRGAAQSYIESMVSPHQQQT